MTELRIKVPQKIAANFAKPARFRVFKGGRGGGKTRPLAMMSAAKVMHLAMEGQSGVWLCGREHLNSLDDSSLSEIKGVITADPALMSFFEVGDKYIRTRLAHALTFKSGWH